MKNYSKITENKDILTKEYADSIYAKINDIPTSTTVSNWGFTKNTGTVTLVAVKMNGATKGTVTSSGTIDLGTVITAHQDISGLMPKSGGTSTGEVKFGSTENFQGYYIKRMLGFLSAGTRYADLDSSYKDGTWHRMWRLRFPSGSNFWGKIKITLYGNYSSFNASGVMSKSVTCNFNTSNIYNNVGCYDGLGVNVEQDFRISEAIWNATASAWEILIWQKNLNGNNSPEIMLECWTTNNTNYINAFNGIAAQTVELTQSTSYSAQRASSTGGTKTVTWATLPVYENPLGEEIATVAMLEDPNTHYTNYLQIKGNNTEAVKFTQDADKTLNFKPGANVSISAASGEITISSTDTNTATAADNILDGSNSGTEITYKPYTSQQSKLSFDTSTTNPTRTDRLNLNGYLYATKLYSGGKEVFTSHQSIKSINTNNTAAQIANVSEAIAGSGTINLHKVSKTGNYNDLLNKLTAGSNITISEENIISAKDTTYTFTANNPTLAWNTTSKIGTIGGVEFNITMPANPDTDTGATSVEVTGAGNAVTAASYNASTRKLTLTKGATFLTSHQDISGKLDKTTYEWNKEFRAGSNGAISLGRYNIYDTQLTFDISSTTSASINGKLVIATQNGRICQAKVFGDATGVLVSKIVIYQSAIVNNRSWVEVFCNFDGWSKNKVHIYGVALESATVTNQMSSVTFTNGVPSPITSGDSKWNGTIDNDLSGKQNKLTAGSNITISGNTISADAYVLPSANSDRLGGIKISFSNGVLTITT